MPCEEDAREAPGGHAGVTAESGTAQNTLYITSSSIGKVPEYNPSEDFSLYLERLEQYFIANFIDEYRRVAVLLTPVKETVFTPDMCLGRESNSMRLSKNRGETINEWYARMNNLAVNCNFGNLLEPILKDKLVMGLMKGKILDRLCEEDKAKGIHELLELAVKREASMSHNRPQGRGGGPVIGPLT
ncbi:hypothetical protein NQ315_014238 [Exocentrus adspersus]|uniref:Uncharacterized protein n=1 Tax=Exocentrus adspersus TaxID=1586481 RepID=A0AAV8VCF4_9CUCU|nr:hypothetical protein NQ315_014238 [Exocentrus adspersus]